MSKEIVLLRPVVDGRSSKRAGWVVAANGCHIWQGSFWPSGYGRVWNDGAYSLVHRVRYEREVGSIPEGTVLDHFACDNKRCCNPAHVRPVSHQENILRGNGEAAKNRSKTHCSKGHALTADNLVKRRLRAGKRTCLTCYREYDRNWKRDRRKGVAA